MGINKLMAGSALALAMTFAPSADAASPELLERIEALEAKLSKMGEMEDTIKDLRAQLEAQGESQEARFNSLSSAAGNAAPEHDFGKGFIPIPGTATAIKFGGYAKLDVTVDDKAHGTDFMNFGAIPLDNSAADNQDRELNFNARQTRLNFTTKTKTALGDLKVFAEGDFFESQAGEAITNRHGFGLRHAYGELGGWKIGQTWTNFQDMAVYPGSLDLIGSVGTTHIRQPQVRYTAALSDDITWTVSVENPSNDVDDALGAGIDSSTGIVPDVVAGLTHKADWGHVGVRGLYRYFNVDNAGADEQTAGWGGAISGKLKLTANDELFGRYVYGDGIGRYLFEANGTGAVFNSGDLETQTAHGGYLNYRRKWNDEWTTNLLAGHTHIDVDTDLTGTGHNEDIYSAHANIIWKPIDQVKFGLEFMHGAREQASGAEGDINRLLFSSFYTF